jgi:hypothetical protein
MYHTRKKNIQIFAILKKYKFSDFGGIGYNNKHGNTRQPRRCMGERLSI